MYMTFQMYVKYVFAQIDTDRYVYLHMNIPPAMPGLSEYYCAPVPAAASAPRCHARPRGMWPVSRVSSPFFEG